MKCQCGNALTITDRGTRCRQCVLAGLVASAAGRRVDQLADLIVDTCHGADGKVLAPHRHIHF